MNWWPDPGVAGKFLAEPLLEWVSSADAVVVDVSEPTFNLAYLTGYAVGKNKTLRAVKSAAFAEDTSLSRELGLFEPFDLKEYQNASELGAICLGTKTQKPLITLDTKPNQRAPIYIVVPKVKTELEIHLVSRVKKTGFQFRSFDPEEQGRISAQELAKHAAASHGVIAPLIPDDRVGSKIHNLRSAFLAGLAAGLEKELLLVQFGDTPVPAQYGELAPRATTRPQIEHLVAEFAPLVASRLGSIAADGVVVSRTFLEKLDLGDPAAENEMNALLDYYLETDEYRRVSRGEVKIVAGRKGVGKTALFVNLRGLLRRNKRTVVLDLKPEGYQLLKFKERVLIYLGQGTREHTITAFWEYLLLLEICHRLLESDRSVHLTNHKLTAPYQELAAAYRGDGYVAEGDFAERMLLLIDRIMGAFETQVGLGSSGTLLTSQKITSLLYTHDVKVLKNRITEYVDGEREVWVLFDNLDKGWPPHGVTADDVMILRCLIDAIAKLERHFRKAEKKCHGVVFIRNDVYEHLVDNSADREKTSRVTLDWTDPNMLKEMLRRRLIANNLPERTTFDEVWRKICVSHVGADDSASYLIDRCLMRPRSLLTLLYQCRSRAVNLGHQQIQVEDIKKGEEAYSSELVASFGLEIQDVYPKARDILYDFIGLSARIGETQIDKVFSALSIDQDDRPKLLELLLWYGFLGVIRPNSEVSYIYDVRYDLKHLKALLRSADGVQRYCINPAFWAGLEIAS